MWVGYNLGCTMGFLMGHSAWQIDQFPTCWPMNGLFVHWSRGWGVSSFSERLVNDNQLCHVLVETCHITIIYIYIMNHEFISFKLEKDVKLSLIGLSNSISMAWLPRTTGNCMRGNKISIHSVRYTIMDGSEWLCMIKIKIKKIACCWHREGVEFVHEIHL